MKIDESFRDLKNLLHLDKLMNQKPEQMGKLIALVRLAFSIGVLTGEGVCDAVLGEPGILSELISELQIQAIDTLHELTIIECKRVHYLIKDNACVNQSCKCCKRFPLCRHVT